MLNLRELTVGVLGSGESVKEKSECEKIGDIIAPSLSTPKNNSFEPKPNHMRNKLDTDPSPPEFPPKSSEPKKRVNFVSTSTGKVWSGEKVGETNPVPLWVLWKGWS